MIAKLTRSFAMSHVFPEGQKVTAFILEYNSQIIEEDLKPDNFSVEDYSLEPMITLCTRTILRVYSNTEPVPSDSPVPGRFVILEMDTSEREAFSIIEYKASGEMDPFGHGSMCYPIPYGRQHAQTEEAGKNGPGPQMNYCGPKPLKVVIRQRKRLHTINGETILPTKVPCIDLICEVVSAFQHCSFDHLSYQLFIPEKYSPKHQYPLIVFIPDAGSRGIDPTTPLIQGVGGVIWATREEQQKHPAFVVCPCFGPEDILTRDDFTCQPKLYQVKALLEHLTEKYSIDRERIYLTGQSMGCMSSCELMCAYPDYFAGAMLVAGQWDPQKCGKYMAHRNLWILVSENDRKAHPGMDAVTEQITIHGGSVARCRLDGSNDPETLSKEANDFCRTQEANVYYTLFAGDTVVPPEEAATSGANHVNTWRVAYQITAVRDWLFRQIRSDGDSENQ